MVLVGNITKLLIRTKDRDLAEEVRARTDTTIIKIKMKPKKGINTDWSLIVNGQAFGFREFGGMMMQNASLSTYLDMVVNKDPDLDTE